MTNAHPIADEVLDLASMPLSKGENWMAYNQSRYLIDKEDVHFFSKEADANEFAKNNISDHENFSVTHITSISDILKIIPYRQEVPRQMNMHVGKYEDKEL